MGTLATRYRVSATCTDYRDVLQYGVDAVMIHAATDVHSTLAAFFLHLGIPTFVDKPLAASAQECENLYELAEKHHQPLYVGFNRRHIPLYNQHLSELAQQECGALRSLRWEKHRHALPGDIRTFVFDDFIHPLDSVNLSRQCNLDDLHLTYHMSEGLLARLDVQWQTGDTLLHASMNRQFGITTEHVTASYDNVAYLFDSFTQGKMWRDNQESRVALKDWTPMLASKGFDAMVQDWLQVAAAGKLPTHIIERNLASHQLAEAICQQITQQVTKG
ncbi:virulence factor [Vibrio cholerae]|uniref:Virulence factor n=1 Tax=Vibrio cholerae TaxID=666 RepID=A0A655VLN5_VIBCL|nr:virulence factor [Vibrio cholerae]CSA31286.1 virulence factor [Vibrio cholerae]CSB22248.1 virulence factor [Vibrio cholerae]CSB33978.1 virulence factor [Vibrio cholerae]CSB50069.1 virulence factor [Vibrio cholerae]